MGIKVLELQKEDFFPQLFANDLIEMRRVTAASCRFAEFLWRNIDESPVEVREDWTLAAWQTHLSNPAIEFYAVYCDGEPAGCFEVSRAKRLMQPRGGTAKVSALGFLPEFLDDGLGPNLLTRVVEKALATGAEKVTIESKRYTDASALNIFRSQGFVDQAG